MENIKENFISLLSSLGYVENNDDVYTANSFLESNNFDTYYKKIIKKINPSLIFCQFNKPFIIFFNKNITNKEIYNIWNSQIPLVFCYIDNKLFIYNGAHLNNDKLEFISSIDINNCNNKTLYCYSNIKKYETLRVLQKTLSDNNLYSSLLNNLKFITDKFKFKYEFSTKLILALLFTIYLIDRQVDLGYKYFTKDNTKYNFLETIKDKSKLILLFDYLNKKFNGNLFDDLNTKNLETLTNDDLMLLYRFFEGKELMYNGQLALFSLYDFDIIPIELISNIYEVLLGEEKQNKDKAYYTPLFLVDYINNFFVKSRIDSSILDPACGSGIFLIKFYRNLIKKNIGQQDFCNNDNILINLLNNCIYGIDKNEEAIDITIFSLYLTMLDYKDPKTLKDFKLPKLKNKNLIVGNFFEDDIKLKLKKKFDYIIGNPPWGNVKDALALKFCKAVKIPNQNNEIARAFMIKALEFATLTTDIIFVLPSKIFYNFDNKARIFRKKFLELCSISNIIELSNIRKEIFKNAIGPALILKYKSSTNNTQQNNISFISMKSNIYYKLFKIFVLESKDIKNVKQSYLYENDWAWKTFVYGTMLDCYTIKNLFQNYESLGDLLKKHNVIYGTGMLTNPGLYDTRKYIGRKLITAECIKPFFYNDSKSTIFNYSNVHRARNEKLFNPPYTLLTVGIDPKTLKLKAVFSNKNFVYKRSVIGLKANPDQKDLLLSITGLLNSSLYSYLNLMLGSSAGIEREQSIFEQILTFPAILDSEISRLVEKIQLEKEKLINNSGELITKLDNLILKKFHLDENPYVDYALKFSIPFATHSYIHKRVTESKIKFYIKYFEDYWNKISKNNFKCKTQYLIDNEYTIVRIILDEKNENKQNDINILKNIIYTKCKNIINKNDIYYFDENSYYIIKSSFDYNWHIMNAEIDLQQMISSIITHYGD